MSNLPSHIAVNTTEGLEENDICVLDWPARTPGLNIIEDGWAKVSKDVLRRRSSRK